MDVLGLFCLAKGFPWGSQPAMALMKQLVDVRELPAPEEGQRPLE